MNKLPSLTQNILRSIKVTNSKSILKLSFAETELSFNPHWLRFNCHSKNSKQEGSGQRTIDINSIPEDLVIEEACIKDENLHIKWHPTSQQPDSVIPVKYLIKNYPSEWNKSTRSYFKTCKDIKFFDYSNLVRENGTKYKEGVFEWLKCLGEYGLCVVRGVEKNENMVKRLAELIAPVQNTIYGEVFDVKVDKNPINIAYSNVPLGFHMDLMYYESPPGLQFLHCLKFDEAIVGGESIFLDSFEVAEDFRQEHPKSFDCLTKIPATFQKIHLNRSRPVYMTFQRPHIVLNHRNKIMAVNWSPPFEGPLKNLTTEDIESYYRSYLKFSKYIDAHRNIIEYRLKPGEVACFNNRRILHGRKGFHSSNGTRHFQGCYLNIDEFKSELLALGTELNSDKELTNNLNEIVYGNHDYYC